MIQRNIVLLDLNRGKPVKSKIMLIQLQVNKLDTTVDKGINFHLVEWANNILAREIWLYQVITKLTSNEMRK